MAALTNFRTKKPRTINKSSVSEKLIEDIFKNIEEGWQKINDLEEEVRLLKKDQNGFYTGKQLEAHIKDRNMDNEVYSIAYAVGMS